MLFLSDLQKPVFFPAGQIHRDVLPTELEAQGIKVDILTVYSSQENANLKEKLRLNLCVSESVFLGLEYLFHFIMHHFWHFYVDRNYRSAVVLSCV